MNMSEHKATIAWRRKDSAFLDGKYSREHTWIFDGGVTVPASPSPAIVPEPFSNAARVDPEEAFVAAVASCHMLTFLFLASQGGFQVESYHDEAVGVMTENEQGIRWISAIDLHPVIAYGGEKIPSAAEEKRLHDYAHRQCFIANSIRSAITLNGSPTHDS